MRATPRFGIVAAALALALAGRPSPGGAGDLSGTFIQLNRAAAARTVAQWQDDLDQMARVGIRTIIVQWSAEDGIAYFRGDLPDREKHDALERLFEAASGRGLAIHLGLRTRRDYWTQLTAREIVLRDYLLVRVSENEQVQKALMKQFGKRPEWAGYYIPDEIDDLNWRTPERIAIIRGYVGLMCDRLRANDAKREISVSAFFRSRTAPHVFARNLLAIAGTNALDHVIVQDGTGVGDPPPRYTPVYFSELSAAWAAPRPDLWCAVEIFEQQSRGEEGFHAAPATFARVEGQIRNAAPHFQELVLFSFLDYMDPDVSEQSAALYNGFINRAAQPPAR